MNGYKKVKNVGHGAFGTVYLCKRLEDDKSVVIKQIMVDDMSAEERQSALNEVKVLSMLHHPNIIGYFDSFMDDQALMIVMEYAPGGTLHEYIQERNERNMFFEEEEIIRIFGQILLALQHIHNYRILHRDLKAHNILLNKSRKIVKIGDFGISKVLTKTNATTIIGTSHYLSPELCQNHPYNQKSDIWATGCILYELCTMKRPFDADNINAIVCRIIRGQYTPISEHFSNELKELIKCLLRLDPAKRPTVKQVMAMPVMINVLFDLQTDMGRIPCRRLPKPVSGFSSALPPKQRSIITDNDSSVNVKKDPGSRKNSGKSINSGAEMSIQSMTDSDMLGMMDQNEAVVYHWGSGVRTPQVVDLPYVDQELIQVAAGRNMKAALTSNGKLIVLEPQVSSDTVSAVTSIEDMTDRPSGVTFLARIPDGLSNVTVTQISCGELFVAALTDKGILHTFGSGTHGCLGHGGTGDVQKSQIVKALLGCTVTQVSCGSHHVLALTDDGTVFTWGRGDNGRLGIGTYDSQSLPVSVELDPSYRPTSVICGSDCSFILSREGVLVAGSNKGNKLAYSDDSVDSYPIEIDEFSPLVSTPLKGEAIKSIATGILHSAFLTEDGVLFTTGSNSYSQLGYEKDRSSITARQVTALQNSIVKLVACGDTFTVAATQDDIIYSWGRGKRGRLGQGAKEMVKEPDVVTFTEEESFIVDALTVSHGNTFAIVRAKLQ